MADKESHAPDETLGKVRFKYVKSNYFRVIHADGAWGGLAPRGNIHMSFYSERGPMPDSSILTIGPDGHPIKPEEAETSSDIVREIECNVIIDLNTAQGLRKWLDEKIEELKQLIKEAQEQQREKQGDQKALKIQR